MKFSAIFFDAKILTLYKNKEELIAIATKEISSYVLWVRSLDVFYSFNYKSFQYKSFQFQLQK